MPIPALTHHGAAKLAARRVRADNTVARLIRAQVKLAEKAERALILEARVAWALRDRLAHRAAKRAAKLTRARAARAARKNKPLYTPAPP